MSAKPDGAFDHRVAVHGSDEEFVATSVPFLLEGLAADGEPPPLVVTTPAKLDMVRDALGRDHRLVEFVSSADWYDGSAPNTLAKAAGYIATNAGPRGQIHAIAEPDWSGRAGSSPRESTEWVRYEAMLNVLLAPFEVTAMCPYDTRVASPSIVSAALRTHPTSMHGAERQVSTSYENPMALIARLDSTPLPPRPADAAVVPVGGDVDGFVVAQAMAHGLSSVEAGVFSSAVAEVVALAPAGFVFAWPLPGASVCEVVSASGDMDDLLIGFRPTGAAEPAPGQGLWFTRQVCSYVDVRSSDSGWVVRVQS